MALLGFQLLVFNHHMFVGNPFHLNIFKQIKLLSAAGVSKVQSACQLRPEMNAYSVHACCQTMC